MAVEIHYKSNHKIATALFVFPTSGLEVMPSEL